MEQVLERLQQLPEALQQEALHYLEGFVARHTAVEPNSVDGKTHPAAEFYGCIADDVDIFEKALIDNPYRRAEILRSVRVIYAA